MKKCISFLVFLLLPIVAGAHAFPVGYSPAAFSSAVITPHEVGVLLSEAVATTSHGMEIFSPSGDVVSGGVPLVDPENSRLLKRGFSYMGDGIYLVSWHGVSAVDGHFTKGAFSFYVGPTSTAPELYGGSVQNAAEHLEKTKLKSSIGATFFLALMIWIGAAFSFLTSVASLVRTDLVPKLLLGDLKRLRSVIGAWMFFVLGVIGALSIWLHLKSLAHVTATEWGRVFLAVLLLSLAAIFLRTISVFVLEHKHCSLRFECVYALLEVGIGFSVFVGAVYLSTIPTPLYGGHLWSVTRTDAARSIIIFDPGLPAKALMLRAFNESGGPIVSAPPTVIFHNTHRGIGPLAVPVKEKGGGMYEIPGAVFVPPGEWHVAITFTEEGAYDVSATISVDYPEDILRARTEAASLRFGLFEVLLVGMVIGITAISMLSLFRLKRSRVQSEMNL